MKNTRIEMRLSQDEKQAIENIADKESKKLSNVIRDALEVHIERKKTPKDRKCFIFYRHYFEAIDGLAPDEKAEILQAIFSYALHGEIIELKSINSKIFFNLVKPQIDGVLEQ